jgi:hypothetical protein
VIRASQLLSVCLCLSGLGGPFSEWVDLFPPEEGFGGTWSPIILVSRRQAAVVLVSGVAW